jgi:hypothetical protein
LAAKLLAALLELLERGCPRRLRTPEVVERDVGGDGVAGSGDDPAFGSPAFTGIRVTRRLRTPEVVERDVEGDGVASGGDEFKRPLAVA